jgi:gliding motility-associated lipoprotein GldH
MCGDHERRTGKSKRTGVECIVEKWLHINLFLIFPIFAKKKFVNKALHLMVSRIHHLVVLIVMVASLSACTKLDVYEKNISIPKYEWSYSYIPTFDFSITDTASSYEIYIVLRHTDAYRYNNIWLNLGTKFPGDSMRYQRFELQLGTDAAGWEGAGMDDIWEVRKPVTKGPVKFSKLGNYTFSLTQVMRENPLPNIMNAGIRVQRVR